MITILKAGLQTTVQDIGRHGYQQYGVTVSGAMDPISSRVANILTGNSEDAPLLEITWSGPEIRFEKDSLISLCGGDLSPAINGKPISGWRPILVKKGDRLSFGKCLRGLRAYLAIAGGIQVPQVMDSHSTYLKAGIGGYHGRALKKGDQLDVMAPSPFIETLIKQPPIKLNWTAAGFALSIFRPSATFRVIPGKQADLFNNQSLLDFYHSPYKITLDSDRMGYRLHGNQLLLKKDAEILSDGVTFGSIQVPLNGQPIILMADRQTTGGYPRIGEVASADLPALAQVLPNTEIRFQEVTLEEAQSSFIIQEKNIALLTQAVKHTFLGGR